MALTGTLQLTHQFPILMVSLNRPGFGYEVFWCHNTGRKYLVFLDFWYLDTSFCTLYKSVYDRNPGGGVLPYKRLIGMCRWMGSHFHDWSDYNGVAFSIDLLEWGCKFSDFGGK